MMRITKMSQSNSSFIKTVTSKRTMEGKQAPSEAAHKQGKRKAWNRVDNGKRDIVKAGE
jgi:hypothetical protein